MQTLPNFRRSQKASHANYHLQTSVHDKEASYPINQDSLRLSQTDRVTLSNAVKTGTLPRSTKVPMSRPGSTGPSEKIYQKPKTIFDSVDSLDQPWYRTSAVKPLANYELNKNTVTKKVEDLERRRLITEPRKKNYYNSEDEENPEVVYREPNVGMVNADSEENFLREQERRLKGRKSTKKRRSQRGCFEDDRMSFEYYKSDDYNSDESGCRSNSVSFCITLFVIFDVLLVIGLNFFGFVLKCSSDGWLYGSDIAQGICKYVWKNMIPFYKRKFVCPSPPTSYFVLEEVDRAPKSYFEKTQPYDYYGRNQNNADNQIRHISYEYEKLISNFTSLYLNNDIYWPIKLPWDSDIGFGHPPSYFSASAILNKPPTDEERRRVTNRLFRTYKPPFNMFHDKDLFINSINYNEDWTFPILTFDAIMLFAIIIPISAIVIGEIFISCLVPSNLTRKRLSNRACFRVPQMIRRLLRYIIMYFGGLYLTICFSEVLKLFFGRLRPDFINACRPIKSACPFWNQQEELKSSRKKIVEANVTGNTSEENSIKNQVITKIISAISQSIEQSRHPYLNKDNNENLDRGYKREIIRMFSLDSCDQKDILVLKDASTSFPSTACAVAFYALTFLAMYLHGLGSIHKAKFMIIPVFNATMFLLTLVLVPMGRIAHRINWVDDAIYGSTIGIFIALYFSIFILRRFKFKEHISNRRIMRKLSYSMK